MNNEPIRVAQIVGKWVGGGVESVIMNYYRNIDRTKIQFDFICDNDSTNIPYDEIESLGGNVILIPPYQKVFKYQKILKKILKENNYKIVHSHINTLSIFSLFAAWRAKIPVRIAHSHSTTNKLEKKKNILKQVLRPFSKLFATHYFACTKHAGKWMFSNKKEIYILNNAIELDKYKYNIDIRNKIRKELNIDEDTLVIGHIGRFVEQKNHKYLIDIFNEIHSKNNNSILILIGQGPLQDEIKDKVNKLGLDNNVLFLGQLDNANEYYQAFDIFLLPSLYEGLGMVLIEAECSGLLSYTSTEVPLEAKVTDNLYYMSLKDNPSIWSNNILDSIKDYNRVSCEDIVKRSGYDITIESSKLVNKYKELYKLNNKDYIGDNNE